MPNFSILQAAILYEKKRNTASRSSPLAVDFYVAIINFVGVDFAKIVEQGDDGRAFRRKNAFPAFFALFVFVLKILNKTVIGFDAVFAQTAHAVGVEFRRSGRIEKVALIRQPVEQFVRAGAMNIFVVNAKKFRFVVVDMPVHIIITVLLNYV